MMVGGERQLRAGPYGLGSIWSPWDRERTGRRDVRVGSGASPACRPTQGAAGSAQVSSRNAGARKPAVHEVETSQWGAKAQLRPAAGIHAEKMAFPVAFPGASGEVSTIWWAIRSKRSAAVADSPVRGPSVIRACSCTNAPVAH